MKSNEFKMPVFGVGPIYVITCLCLTILGLFLHVSGFLSAGECKEGKIFFFVIGFILILFGIYLWIQAILVEKIDKKVQENELITTGIYSFVRNPVYTAFLFIFTGTLLFTANYMLLIMPVIFWAFLTILLKHTEEKWLKTIFGEEYEIYSAEVNRIIPWFRRRKNK
ncbi:MAG: isoprenylcysteine carboxylmethyltransferase family protein [Coriobacteriia bacterium]|nr:isoprenylcysteine carboxylmethyltransferase family protein [Coriobacteriia bacterium]